MKIKLIKVIVLLVMGMSGLYNCSIKALGVKAAMPVLDDINAAVFKQSDIALVETALPATLIIIEGLLETSPENQDLLAMAAQALCAYGFGFIEDKDKDRAKAIYIKGRDYGIKALRQNGKFNKALKKKIPFWDAVKVINDKDMLPALFWTGQCIGNLVNLDMSDPENLVDIPKAKALMEKVMEFDDKFFFGGAHIFMGAYYAILPALFGGGLDKSEVEFKKAFEISQEKFLVAYYYYARFYVTTLKDAELFDKTIAKIENTPSDVLPEQKLINEIAKKKAKVLIGSKAKFF